MLISFIVCLGSRISFLGFVLYWLVVKILVYVISALFLGRSSILLIIVFFYFFSVLFLRYLIVCIDILNMRNWGRCFAADRGLTA